VSGPRAESAAEHPSGTTSDTTSDGNREERKAMLIGLILVSVMLASLAQLTLKHGVNQAFPPPSAFKLDGHSIRSMVATPTVWLGIALFGISAIVWIAVLSRTTLSFAYPFVSLTYVLILAVDAFVLHESVPALRWGGVALIVSGIILISRTPHG
jgi:drug/metabolite transporter (DMT)-like permease